MAAALSTQPWNRRRHLKRASKAHVGEVLDSLAGPAFRSPTKPAATLTDRPTAEPNQVSPPFQCQPYPAGRRIRPNYPRYWNLMSSTVNEDVPALPVPTVPVETVTYHWRPTTCLAFSAVHLAKSASVKVIVEGVLEGVPIEITFGSCPWRYPRFR